MDKKLNNPWKGLDFYNEGEILYGRNVEIQSLSQYIFNNTQTVLYGRSGIGKSSILYAGIFPKARLEGMMPVSIRLKHDDVDNYIWQIRAAIKNSGIKMKSILSTINGHDKETLWEFMHRHNFYKENGQPCVPLLVFDQFEEIFTLQKHENIKRDFFNQLGHLLNDVKPDYVTEYEKKNRQLQSEEQETKVISSGAFKGMNLKLSIRRADVNEQNVSWYIEHPKYHIVFAMREDFLSSLELYASNIPVMKDNRYGLLPNDVICAIDRRNIIHSHDIGVTQHSNRLTFCMETTAKILIFQVIILEDLNSHHTVKSMAFCFIYHGHTANADHFQDLVAVIQ